MLLVPPWQDQEQKKPAVSKPKPRQRAFAE